MVGGGDGANHVDTRGLCSPLAPSCSLLSVVTAADTIATLRALISDTVEHRARLDDVTTPRVGSA